MVSPITNPLQTLLISTSKLLFLLIFFAVILTIATHVFISLIERIVKVPVKPIIDSIAFPGIIMKNALIKMTASLLGYDLNVPLYTSPEKINYEAFFYSKMRSSMHLFIVIFSPYLNLAIAFFLIASKSLVISFLPGILVLPYSITTIYLSISIIVSGLPTAQDVFIFFNTMVQNSPWFFVLTVWGIIAAAIMNQVLGTTFTFLFWCFYETLLILFELKNTPLYFTDKEKSVSSSFRKAKTETKKKPPEIVTIMVNDYNKKGS